MQIYFIYFDIPNSTQQISYQFHNKMQDFSVKEEKNLSGCFHVGICQSGHRSIEKRYKRMSSAFIESSCDFFLPRKTKCFCLFYCSTNVEWSSL